MPREGLTDQFWLTGEQFTQIAPHLPLDTRGKERVDDRRVISGIVHMLKSGVRRTDVPRDVYGPKKTLYNRFVSWAASGSGLCCSRPSPMSGGHPPRC